MKRGSRCCAIFWYGGITSRRTYLKISENRVDPVGCRNILGFTSNRDGRLTTTASIWTDPSRRVLRRAQCLLGPVFCPSKKIGDRPVYPGFWSHFAAVGEGNRWKIIEVCYCFSTVRHQLLALNFPGLDTTTPNKTQDFIGPNQY